MDTGGRNEVVKRNAAAEDCTNIIAARYRYRRPPVQNH